jgi:PAS domain S-box-containing protein
LKDEKFYADMSSLNNELVNLQRELVKKNIELEKRNGNLKASEEALREALSLFAEVANTSPALFWMSQEKNLRTWFNQPWLHFTGRTLKEESGNGWASGIHPDDLKRCLSIINRAVKAKQPFKVEYRLRSHDGGYRWFYDQGNPRHDLKNNFAGYIGFCVDISERKEAEARTTEMEALKRANQAKSELLANVSHELRTPLASVKGYIETLIEPDVKWSKKQQLEFLQLANKEADRLTFLIRDLLDMSRLDSGMLTLDKRFYPVREILDSASGVLASITANHKLKIVSLADLPPVQVDKIRIAQVISNLVDNAAKFSEQGSQIVISTGLKDGEIIFSVEDSGIGMPPEVVEKLFDRFYQSYRVVSGKTRGTGLGLSICKGIVEAHGGKIWVESQPGKGSKISFSIPVGK